MAKTKIRHQFELDQALSERLSRLAEKPGATKSSLIATALESWLNRDGASQADDRFGLRLNRMSNQLARLERDGHILGIKTQTPTTVDVLRKNPLGIYVEAISWSREFDGSAPEPRSNARITAQTDNEVSAAQANEASPNTAADPTAPIGPDPNQTPASERTKP